MLVSISRQVSYFEFRLKSGKVDVSGKRLIGRPTTISRTIVALSDLIEPIRNDSGTSFEKIVTLHEYTKIKKSGVCSGQGYANICTTVRKKVDSCVLNACCWQKSHARWQCKRCKARSLHCNKVTWQLWKIKGTILHRYNRINISYKLYKTSYKKYNNWIIELKYGNSVQCKIFS